MTGSVHAAVGALIGKHVKNKPLAFTLGVLSHGIGDMIPHHDLSAAEVPFAVGTLLRIGQQHGWKSSEFICALGAVAPDLEHIPYELKKDPRRFQAMDVKWFPTHNNKLNHAGWPWDKRLGVLMQIVLWALGMYLSGSLGGPKKK
jgi:hypothetical protein